jgi:hypothetical protein
VKKAKGLLSKKGKYLVWLKKIPYFK